MIGHVYHQHLVIQLRGIVGKQSGKEQLLVIAMGGEENQIGSVLRRCFPLLDGIGHPARGVDGEFVDGNGAVIEGQSHAGRGSAEDLHQILEFIEESVGAAGMHGTGIVVGHSIGAVGEPEDQIQGTDSAFVVQCHVGLVCAGIAVIGFAVEQRIQVDAICIGNQRAAGDILRQKLRRRCRLSFLSLGRQETGTQQAQA